MFSYESMVLLRKTNKLKIRLGISYSCIVANENMLGRSFLGSKLSPPLKRYEKFHYGELRLQNGILSSRPLFFCSHATCVCQGTQNILAFKRASCLLLYYFEIIIQNISSSELLHAIWGRQGSMINTHPCT